MDAVSTVVITLAIPAFMWAGGPDVPDALYVWRIASVSIPNGYAISYTRPGSYQSRNSCETNRRPLMQTDPNTYTACLPSPRP
jgi:hypothetical protein